jgi:hypothetical protein
VVDEALACDLALLEGEQWREVGLKNNVFQGQVKLA